jgi:hypothetical protein
MPLFKKRKKETEQTQADKSEDLENGAVLFSDDEEVMNTKLDNRDRDGDILYKKLNDQWEINRGMVTNVGTIEIDGKQMKRITNSIFPKIRSMVGLETDQMTKPVVKMPLWRAIDENDELDAEIRDKMLDKADDFESYFRQRWQELKGQTILTKLFFQKHLYDDAFLIPNWDFDGDDFEFVNIRTKDVKIDPNATSVRDADWVKLIQFYSKSKATEKFGKESADKIKYGSYDVNETTSEYGSDKSAEGAGDDKLRKSTAKVETWLFDGFTIYRTDAKDGESKKLILKKLINPYYNFDSDGEQYRKYIEGNPDKEGQLGLFEKAKDEETDEFDDDKVNKIFEDIKENKVEGEELDSTFEPVKNYFKYPRKTIIHFPAYSTGDTLYSFPNFQQGIPLANNIETTKQRFKRYEEHASEPTTYYNASNIAPDDAKKFQRRRAGETVGIPLDGDENLRDNVLWDNGKEMPVSVFNNMADNEQKLDDIFGNNDLTRGVSDPGNPTKGGIEAVQRADQTPIRLLTRNDEDAMQEVYEWMMQMIALFYTDKTHFIERDDDDLGKYETPITNKDIVEGIKVLVKTGSTMPVDKESQREGLRVDTARGILSPQTYYESLDEIEDPKAEANRLANWKNQGIVSDAPAQPPVEELPDGEGGGQDGEPNARMAMEENNQMMTGMMVDIKQGEDSKIHYDLHLRGIAEVEKMPEGEEKEKAKAAFVEHIKETAEALGQQGINVEEL